MRLEDDGLIGAQRVRDGSLLLGGQSRRAVSRMVSQIAIERARVLRADRHGDTKTGKGLAKDRMRVNDRVDLLPTASRRVGVNREALAERECVEGTHGSTLVDRQMDLHSSDVNLPHPLPASLEHCPLVIDAHQMIDLHQTKGRPLGIAPEGLRINTVPQSDLGRRASVEIGVTGEVSHGRHETMLKVRPLQERRREGRRSGERRERALGERQQKVGS